MTNKFGKKREKSASGSSEGGETQAEREQDIPYPRKRVRWNVTSESLEESRQDQSDSDAVELDKAGKSPCLSYVSDVYSLTVRVRLCASGRLGCAYYDYLKRAICVLEDSKEDGHCDLTKMLVEQVKPNVILASSKSDETGITLLQDYADASGCIVQIRPHREFVASKGRDRLLSLRLLAEFSGEVDNTSDISSEASKANGLWSAYDFMRKRTRETGDPNMKRWNAAIRLANFATLDSAPLCLSSIGALIDFLARERAANDLDEGGPETLDIQGIEILTLDDVMHINADALCSLQVFQSETHASIHSDKAKEGLSLFGARIDWEESAEVHRVCIRSHIDRDLDNRKHVYRGIDSVLVCLSEYLSLDE
ncbi:hypothetical protein ID866_7726 [Astraeus odoratus]|nr:hypothetical protein ID866_7726 [Astraeus odoratus]